MANEWKSKYAIIRDLAAVTRGSVCVDIGASITCDRPPAYAVTEEIEDEFLRQCSGDSPTAEGPDLMSIQNMLKAIAEPEPPSDGGGDGMSLTKLNPLSQEFVPTAAPLATDQADRLAEEIKLKIASNPKTGKARRERNVAVASLLKVRAGLAPLGATLLTPDHFMKVEEATQDIDQAKSELSLNKQVQDSSRDAKPVPERDVKETGTVKVKGKSKSKPVNSVGKVKVTASMAAVSAAGMFKKRAVNADPPTTDSCQVSQQAEVLKPKSFVPSAQAEQLYNKFKQMSDQKQALAEDIWSAASRRMRELDAAAAAEAEARAQQEVAETLRQLEDEDLVGCQENGTAGFPSAVLLARHRHAYDEPCEVCRACAAPSPSAKDTVGANVCSMDNVDDDSLTKDALLNDASNNAAVVDTVVKSPMDREEVVNNYIEEDTLLDGVSEHVISGDDTVIISPVSKEEIFFYVEGTKDEFIDDEEEISNTANKTSITISPVDRNEDTNEYDKDNKNSLLNEAKKVATAGDTDIISPMDEEKNSNDLSNKDTLLDEASEHAISGGDSAIISPVEKEEDENGSIEGNKKALLSEASEHTIAGNNTDIITLVDRLDETNECVKGNKYASLNASKNATVRDTPIISPVDREEDDIERTILDVNDTAMVSPDNKKVDYLMDAEDLLLEKKNISITESDPSNFSSMCKEVDVDNYVTNIALLDDTRKGKAIEGDDINKVDNVEDNSLETKDILLNDGDEISITQGDNKYIIVDSLTGTTNLSKVTIDDDSANLSSVEKDNTDSLVKDALLDGENKAAVTKDDTAVNVSSIDVVTGSNN